MISTIPHLCIYFWIIYVYIFVHLCLCCQEYLCPSLQYKFCRIKKSLLKIAASELLMNC